MKIFENGKMRDATEEEIKQFSTPNSYEGLSYPELVVMFIREKYTIDDEIALHRQREIKPEEYKAYYDFCEECKIRAREIVK